jgi:hypothetical protein
VAGSSADRTIARQQRIEEQLAAELGSLSVSKAL